MRLVPAAQGSFRVAQEDMSFDGFRIPKSWKARERERENGIESMTNFQHRS